MFISHIIYLCCILLSFTSYVNNISIKEKITKILQKDFATIDEYDIGDFVKEYSDLLFSIQKIFPYVEVSDSEDEGTELEDAKSEVSDDNDPLVRDIADLSSLLEKNVSPYDKKIHSYLFDHVQQVLEECGIDDDSINEIIGMTDKKYSYKEIQRKFCKILLSFIYENRKELMKLSAYKSCSPYLHTSYKIFFDKEWSDNPYEGIFDV